MAKIIIFLISFLSARHLPHALEFGLRAQIKNKRIVLLQKNEKALCLIRASTQVVIFKSLYCYKKYKYSKKGSGFTKIILIKSQKKRPPQVREGLLIFIPIKNWGQIHFAETST